MKDPEERRSINDEEVVGADAAPPESDKTADDFSGVDVANFESIPRGKATSDWRTESVGGFVVFVIVAEGADLRRIRAAMVGMFATVTNEDGVLIEVRRCGTV